MTSRIDTITTVLRRPQPVRPLAGHELRGSVVQLLGPGTTDPTWTATPRLLAEAIDQGLLREEGERKDIPVTGSQPVAGTVDSARAEILAVLQAAGYNTVAAAELLARAHREPHAAPPDEEFRETLAGGHALIVQHGGCEFLGSCQCGRALGRITPDKPLDGLVGLWERHTCTELAHG